MADTKAVEWELNWAGMMVSWRVAPRVLRKVVRRVERRADSRVVKMAAMSVAWTAEKRAEM